MRFLLSMLLIPVLAIAQTETDVQRIFPIQNISVFSVDRLGNIYAVVDGNIIKADTTGKILQTYSNKTVGAFELIDASNPLRILAYSKEFSTIFFFDNKLSVQSTVNLREQFMYDAGTVATSNSDGFWLYDNIQNKLFKYSYLLKNTAQSQPFNLLVNDALNITGIIENDKWLICHNTGVGFMLFDRFGSYIKTWRTVDATAFMILENTMVYFEKGDLVFVDLALNSEIKRIHTSYSNADEIQWFYNSFYMLHHQQIGIFYIRD
ncbi:MAG: hypothetical protein BWX95_01156 [Bacteroidetes bacterium ADurb.Bin141]|nr:MAG: hypothetical protein BWX95_01156 [Bacteroidetes bacterium ADurb.Bin141]